MGLHTKLYVTVLVLWLVLSELVTSCPQSCESTNSGTQECIYKVKLKENISSEMLMTCCDFRNTMYSNKTYTKVTVLFTVNWKNCFLNMNYAFLNVNEFVLKDNNLTLIQLNVNNKYVKSIDMSSNKLIVIKKGIIDMFKNLRELNLRNNNIERIEKDSFIGLNKLETLDLSQNKLSVLNSFLEPLKSLQQLNLSKNNIEFIHENYFNNSLLQTLDLSYNNLKRVVSGAFHLLPNLVQLLLSDNPALGTAQHDTQLLVGSGRRLQQIDASRTGLHQVPEAFTQSVRFLSLDGNLITSVLCGDFDSYPLLQSLELTKNEISSVEDDSLGRLEMLLLLNFNDNKLSAVPTSLTEKLKYLSINNNLIMNLTETDFRNLSNLEILLLQNNKISYIEENTFSDLLTLKVLDLSYNPVKTLSTSTFDGPLSLRDLRLCNINVSVPEKDGSFPMSSPESIRKLHLQSSPGLARQLLADSAALAALSHLQYLDLRMNNLSEIRNDLLFYLGQLKTLRLHGNCFKCRDENWLKDWLNWNGSVANGETCYYATSAPLEEVEYSLSTIFFKSDVLPPLNLYTTDKMIENLQTYYGYYENKSEKANNENLSKNFTDSYSITAAYKLNITSIEKNLIPGYFRRDIYFPTIKLNDIQTKAKKIAKMLDQKPHVTVNNNMEMKIKQDSLESHINGRNEGGAQTYKTKPSLGRSLNTPINLTAITNNENTRRREKQTNTTESGETTLNTLNTKTHIEENMSEPLRYESEKVNFLRYLGTIFVIFVMTSIVFWAILHLKQKRRSIVEEQEQIEVVNISGGVLW